MSRFVKHFVILILCFEMKKLGKTCDQTYMRQLNACLDDKESLSEKGQIMSLFTDLDQVIDLPRLTGSTKSRR